MEKFFLILIIAALSYEAFGMSNRQKRQNEEEGDLEDRFGWNWLNSGRFPPWRPGPQLPNPGSRPEPVPRPDPVPRPVPDQSTTSSTSTANPNVDGNQANIDQCRRTCPVTSEYNPVCGTNGVTYNNPSRLFCDQSCGVSVTLLRSSRCPTATVAPTA